MAPDPDSTQPGVSLAAPAALVKSNTLHYHHPVGRSQGVWPAGPSWVDSACYLALTEVGVCFASPLTLQHSSKFFSLKKELKLQWCPWFFPNEMTPLGKLQLFTPHPSRCFHSDVIGAQRSGPGCFYVCFPHSEEMLQRKNFESGKGGDGQKRGTEKGLAFRRTVSARDG